MKSIQKMSDPSSGGNIPARKLVKGEDIEGTGANYQRNVNQTSIKGDGVVTERPVSSKRQVKRVQTNANSDVSSRKKSTWGN
jgi:hypothetical protein